MDLWVYLLCKRPVLGRMGRFFRNAHSPLCFLIANASFFQTYNRISAPLLGFMKTIGKVLVELVHALWDGIFLHDSIDGNHPYTTGQIF